MSIVVSVEFFGLLSGRNETDQLLLNISEGSTVFDVFHLLDFSKNDYDYIVSIRNNTIVKHSTQLKNGDEILLTMPLGGG